MLFRKLIEVPLCVHVICIYYDIQMIVWYMMLHR